MVLSTRRTFELVGIENIDDLYNQVVQHLQLADWFGRNLDALDDVLRGDCGAVDPKGTTFVWKESAQSKTLLGENLFDEIVDVFRTHSRGGEEEDDDVELVLV